MTSLSIRAVLLDIEGTTSSIAFVYDVMFPYVRQHLRDFMQKNQLRTDVLASVDQLAKDAGFEDAQAWQAAHAQPSDSAFEQIKNDQSYVDFVTDHVKALMDGDSKSTGLKAVQGFIWQAGFESGQLESHLFPDVFPAIERWNRQGISIGIYSSGSIVAQKLFFGHTPHGDLTPFFERHYDTTIGPKRDLASYKKIADDFGFKPNDILFLSDIAAELEAARAAGLQAIAVVRPGNAALPDSYQGARIESFTEIAVALQANAQRLMNNPG